MASTSNKGSSKGKTSSSKKQTKAQAQAELEASEKIHRRITSILIFCVSAILFFVFIVRGEAFWQTMHSFVWGMFGFCGVLIPIFLGYVAYQHGKSERPYRLGLRIFLAALLVTLFSTAVFLFGHSSVGDGIFSAIGSAYNEGTAYHGGGLYSALFGAPLLAILGTTGARIIISILLFTAIMIASGATIISFIDFFKNPVKDVSYKVSDKVSEKREIHTKRREEIREYKRAHPKEKQRSIYIYGGKSQKPADRSSIDIPLDDEYSAAHTSFKPPNIIPDDYLHENVIPENMENIPVTEVTVSSVLHKKSKKRKAGDLAKVDSIDATVDTTAEVIENGSAESLNSILSKTDSQTISEALERFNQSKKGRKKSTPDEASEPFVVNSENEEIIEGMYIKPPVTLLEPTPNIDEGDIAAELNHNGTMLIEMLSSFGVKASIVNICRGPSVTRYELQPAAGVKISKITNLSDDIAMNLAAVGVRIEAPIPGKSAVGVEVPNKVVSIVKMREILESAEFNKAKSNLTVALGRDIEGDITLADLSKMPHLLIAGSTGSGKSVCINSMLVSLLYKSTPDEVKLLMIDPKVVELGIYNGIPHLLVPVVTDPRKAAGALNWAVNHMLERYKLFAENNVRDIRGYNALVDKLNAQADAEETTEQVDENDLDEYEMPQTPEERQMMDAARYETETEGTKTKKEKRKKLEQIVIVIDELADLMMAAPSEVENSICRLAQMARAAGMHLVIATQRPSVDVITGIIKANIPSRIAFAVKSQVDSRTILDTGGADKLLGRGDMLFAPIGATKPKRVQGCFVNDEEIEKVIDFVKNSRVTEYDEQIAQEIENNAIPENNAKNSDTSNESDMDPMMEDAIKCVVEAGQASTSLLQRRLRLGYARAGRLIDEMEMLGIVGPHEGSKPRQVLMTHQQYLERCMARGESTVSMPTQTSLNELPIDDE